MAGLYKKMSEPVTALGVKNIPSVTFGFDVIIDQHSDHQHCFTTVQWQSDSIQGNGLF